MAEVKVTWKTPPEYEEVKDAQLTSTYEQKSFKSYERPEVAPSTEGRHMITDDIDDGGGYGNE